MSAIYFQGLTQYINLAKRKEPLVFCIPQYDQHHHVQKTNVIYIEFTCL